MIGAYNLKEAENFRITVPIRFIHVHPDWQPNALSYDADIAILELDREVEFTNVIQPICLIEPNSHLNTILNGETVGFGVDENRQHGGYAVVINTPIQSIEKCISSNDHQNLISHRTFCGGNADGTGVCVGDSGSGLYVYKNMKFFLRGIVSSSISGGEYGCDVSKYAIFTDVVKYYSWIKSRGMFDAETKVQLLESEITNITTYFG